MKIKKEVISMLYLLLVVWLGSCSTEEVPSESKEEIEEDSVKMVNPIAISVSRTFTDQTLYASGDAITLQAFDIENQSDQTVNIDSLWIRIGTASTDSKTVVSHKVLTGYTAIAAGAQLTIEAGEIIAGDESLEARGYLVSLGMKLSSPDTTEMLDQLVDGYLTFFRISDTGANLTYDIAQEDYNGLPVFKLTGGLSAEYAVQKAAASLTGGISHSWNVQSAGNGPAPIHPTPDFIERSVNKTIDFYNETLGATTKLQTVVIGTGITPVSYISHTLGAPILPVHFLVGAHTVKEVQTMLDYSESTGISAYATVGHDYSLSSTQSVAWMKLLDLPEAYQKFLKDHQVENIVFFGATSSGGGEKAARKYLDDNAHYESGSIYLMYFAGNEAEGYLRQVIRDFDTDQLGGLINISDWESGVIQAQVTAMSATARATTSVSSINLVTSSADDIHLWNMASFTMLRYFQKNNIELKGVSLNPYLIGHPLYETYAGYVPFVYWQGVPASYHIDRINTVLEPAIDEYRSGADFKNLKFAINSTRNFGGVTQGGDISQALTAEGFTNLDLVALYTDEIWDMTDGINSASEVRAKEILDHIAPADLAAWNNGLTPLTITDLQDISTTFPNVTIESK